MWAMMPIFRILSSDVVRGIAFLYSAKTRGDQDAPLVCRGPVSLRRHREAFGLLDAGSLEAGSRSCWSRAHARALCPGAKSPPVMREGAVRLRHPVRVFLFLYRLAFAFRRQDQLGGVALGHRLLLAGAAVLDDPAHPQGRA